MGLATNSGGQAPSPWPYRPLSLVATKIQDGTHFSPQSTMGPFRYVTSRNIRSGYLDLDSCGWISEREHERIFRRCNPRYGDILLTKDGANTGNAALNSLREEISLLSSVAMIRPDPSVADEHFLLQYLLSPAGQTRLTDLVSGNAITRLTLAKIKSFEVPTPPLPEQRAIASVLDILDDVIRTTERIIAKLRQVKQGLLHDLLTLGIDDNGELRDPERHPEKFQDSPVGRVPATWAITSIGEQVSSTTLGTARRGASPSMADNLRLLKMGNLDWGTVDASKCELVAKQNVENWESLLLAPGDLLFNTRNTPELVGKTAAWREPSADVIPDNNIMRVRFHRVVGGTFVATYMSSVGQRAVSRMATGTTSVAAIYWRDLHRFTFPMPSRVEQDTIIERLDALDARIEAENASLAVYRQLKTGLSEDLLSGRVRATSLTEVAA